jgi:hypothetical protein
MRGQDLKGAQVVETPDDMRAAVITTGQQQADGVDGDAPFPGMPAA